MKSTSQRPPCVPFSVRSNIIKGRYSFHNDVARSYQPTTAQLNESEIVSLVSADEEKEEEENTSPEKKVTVQEALAAAQTLQSFLDYHGDDVHQHSLVQLKCLLPDT